MLEERNFAEVIVPHTNVTTVAGVAGVTIAIGEMSGFI